MQENSCNRILKKVIGGHESSNEHKIAERHEKSAGQDR